MSSDYTVLAHPGQHNASQKDRMVEIAEKRRLAGLFFKTEGGG